MMNREEFESRLQALPVEEPDEIDTAMMEEAEKMNDGSRMTMSEFQDNLEGYSGKLVIRLPKSLHKKLKEEAKAEGVSLNQYMIYKLAM